MTVEQLIKKLQKHPSNMTVVIEEQIFGGFCENVKIKEVGVVEDDEEVFLYVKDMVIEKDDGTTEKPKPTNKYLVITG